MSVSPGLPAPIVYTFMPSASAIFVAVSGSISPTLFLPSVRSITTLLFAFELFSLSQDCARPRPIAVPSSIIPTFAFLKSSIITPWSVVRGHCVYAYRAKRTRPILSDLLPSIKSSATSFAT